MNLIIDVGNTAIKLAVFDFGKLMFDEVVAEDTFVKNIQNVFDSYPNIDAAIVSSVGILEHKKIAALSIFCKVQLVDHTTKTPYKNSYATPKSLGVDRIALATAAFYHSAHGNTLVIDAGTCITFDMINDYGEYLGGAISPGIAMRYKAMHNQTAKLPLLEKTALSDFIGNSTETSMHSGVVNGVCLEIDGVIDQYKSRFADLTVILTGGDAQFLSKRLKNTIFADLKFLLKGLNYLLEYNKH